MSSGQKQGARAPAAALAPGFRFHPTDEELVGYYLKRKIAGKPFRVDAISDVDLYKSEPWDLPGKSRIQSRDMEWYFFSALDKKYANRSRTNRATGSGYWKTTGKDRPVFRGGRPTGMKKTLVFHIGRAPKGERTNWVMHEYRLEDEELARAGISQDAFVVCRVFHKKGPGPQNGAQYGAPFVEEEWEGDEGEPVLEEDDGEVALNVINDPLIADMDELEQNQDGSVQDQADLVDLNSLIEMCDAQALADAMDGNIGDHGQLTDESQGLALLNDEFLELNDFAPSPLGATYPEEAPSNLPNGSSSDISNLGIVADLEAPAMEDIFNPVGEGYDFSEPFLLDQAADGSSYLEVNDILGAGPGHYSPPGVNGDEEALFFDAPTVNPEDNFLDSLVSGSSGPDLDELIAYFDAPENMVPSGVDFEAVASPSNDPVVNYDDLQARRESPQTPEFTPPRGVGFVDELGDGRARGGFSGRLISMLGAISSPPALAAEKNPREGGAGDASLEKTLAAFSPGSVRITPAIIRSWQVEKNAGDVGFLLAYGGGFEKPPKIAGGLLSFIQRNSFHLLFLSVLLLAASYKICVCAYSR